MILQPGLEAFESLAHSFDAWKRKNYTVRKIIPNDQTFFDYWVRGSAKYHYVKLDTCFNDKGQHARRCKGKRAIWHKWPHGKRYTKQFEDLA